jgi:hypothetical protein
MCLLRLRRARLAAAARPPVRRTGRGGVRACDAARGRARVRPACRRKVRRPPAPVRRSARCAA